MEKIKEAFEKWAAVPLLVADIAMSLNAIARSLNSFVQSYDLAHDIAAVEEETDEFSGSPDFVYSKEGRNKN